MLVPESVTVSQNGTRMELTYPGEAPVVLSAEFLRVHSPSAEVQGHTPDEAVLQVGKADVRIEGVEPVGLYALKLVFSDGHDSGLYSWDYLRRLATEHDRLWEEYLQALKEKGASRDPNDPANAPFQPKPRHTCSHA